MLLNGSVESPAITGGNTAPGAGADWTVPNPGDHVYTNNEEEGITPYGTQ